MTLTPIAPRGGALAAPTQPVASRSHTVHLPWWPVVVAIGVLGFAARLVLMLRGGGLLGVGSYDDGVYFSAADALVHGRLPYRDFLFIQPPGVVLAATPFAWLGSVTTDPIGMVAGRLVFMAIGGANAALVALILLRFGRRASVVGGVFYAVFFAAVYAERTILLEPLGTFAMLSGMLIATRMRRESDLLPLVAGVALGLGLGVKIWYVIPVAIIVLAQRRGRLRMIAGTIAAAAAVYLPFFVAAPAASFREIVLDQLGRPSTDVTIGKRLESIVSASRLVGVPLKTVAIVFLLLVAAAIVVTFITRGARRFAVLTVVTGALLLVTPSFFAHYSDLTAPFLALTVGVAVGRITAVPRSAPVRNGLAVAMIAGVLLTNARLDLHGAGTAAPVAGLQTAAARTTGCITSDDPTILAGMNVLSRDLRDRSCALWPDVTGWTYDANTLRIDGKPIQRRDNPGWQAHVHAYLESGSATILIRAETGLSAATRSDIDRGAVLYRSGHWVLHSTRVAP